jgi:adenosylhomocysteine nucleosidase
VTRVDEIVLAERTFIYDIVELMGDPDVAAYYSAQLDLSWLREPLPHPVRRGCLASADSDLPPGRIADLRARGAIAGDWESGALAWVASKNRARLLILRGVSDVVNERHGEAYDNFELFTARTRRIMRTLFDQLPDWLNSVRI